MHQLYTYISVIGANHTHIYQQLMQNITKAVVYMSLRLNIIAFS